MPNEADLSRAISADLYFEDFSFQLLTLEYGLNRNADQRGFPTDAPKRIMVMAKIRLTSMEDEHVRLLYDWALNSDKKMDGFIIFTNHDDHSVEIRRVHVEGAICVGFRECFQNEQSNLLRAEQTFHLPGTADYLPSYRGRGFFTNGFTTRDFQLVMSADKVLIEGSDIPS